MNRFQELAVSFAALAMVGLIVVSEGMEMSDSAHMTVIVIFAIIILIYGSLMFRENPADEREHEVRLQANKIAVMVGAGLLSIGTIVQSFQHDLDIWMPITLAAMVVAKSIAYLVKK